MYYFMMVLACIATISYGAASKTGTAQREIYHPCAQRPVRVSGEHPLRETSITPFESPAPVSIAVIPVTPRVTVIKYRPSQPSEPRIYGIDYTQIDCTAVASAARALQENAKEQASAPETRTASSILKSSAFIPRTCKKRPLANITSKQVKKS